MTMLVTWRQISIGCNNIHTRSSLISCFASKRKSSKNVEEKTETEKRIVLLVIFFPKMR